MLVPLNLLLYDFVTFKEILANRTNRLTDSALQVALNPLHVAEVEADTEPRIWLTGTDIH